MANIDLSNYDIEPVAVETTGQKKEKDSSASKSFFDYLNTDINLFNRGLSNKKKEKFYSELNILLSAGVDIKSALELIADQQKKNKDAQLFIKIKEAVVQGATFSEAVSKSGLFSKHEFYSLQIGEETGKINEVLKELADFYQNKIEQKRQVINALSYPSIVILTAVGAVFFMLHFIVPMFRDVFTRFGQDLPAITTTVLKISHFFSTYYLYFGVSLLLLVIGLYTQRKKSWYRRWSSYIVLKLPVIGSLVEKIYIARFCQSMRLLLGAEIPMLRSVQLIKEMIGFYPIEYSLTYIQQDILQGESLFKSLSRYPIYSKRLLSLVKVGEGVNQLEAMFEKLADQYSEEVKYQTKLLERFIEPALIIFLGLFVGIILVAMYLPMFKLGAAF